MPENKKITGQREFNYQCKSNDNELKVIIQDGKIDEVWVRDALKKGWTVIGIEDIEAAFELAKTSFYCECKERSSFYRDKEDNDICSDCDKTIK